MILVVFLNRWRGARRGPVRLGSPPPGWPGSRTLLYLVPIALAGCQSSWHRDQPKPNAPIVADSVVPVQMTATQLSANPNGKPPAPNDPALAQSAFNGKLTNEQRYNAHLELGRFQESQENFDFALAEYQKALEACDAHTPLMGGVKSAARQAMAHRRMGSALDRLGRFEQAENEYSTALKLNPNDPKVWNDAGYSYYLQGRWADAERTLKTAARLDPNNTKIMTNLGLNLAASGKTDEALAELTKAGGRAAGHTNLAYILAAMGKTAEAEKHYKLALEFQPQMEPARVALAALSARTAHEAQIAAASRPPTEAPPLLIGQPGVLPVAALPQPPPTGITLLPQASATTAPVAALPAPTIARTTLVAQAPATAAPVPALPLPTVATTTLVSRAPATTTPVATPRQPTPAVTAVVPRAPATPPRVATLRRPTPAATNLVRRPPAATPPVATLRQPSTAATNLTARATGTTTPWPKPMDRINRAPTPSQTPSVARLTPSVPVDAAVKRTVSSVPAPAPTPKPKPAPRRPPLATPPLPIPAPMPVPGPVPPFVPPATN